MGDRRAGGHARHGPGYLAEFHRTDRIVLGASLAMFGERDPNPASRRLPRVDQRPAQARKCFSLRGLRSFRSSAGPARHRRRSPCHRRAQERPSDSDWRRTERSERGGASGSVPQSEWAPSDGLFPYHIGNSHTVAVFPLFSVSAIRDKNHCYHVAVGPYALSVTRQFSLVSFAIFHHVLSKTSK